MQEYAGWNYIYFGRHRKEGEAGPAQVHRAFTDAINKAVTDAINATATDATNAFLSKLLSNACV